MTAGARVTVIHRGCEDYGRCGTITAPGTCAGSYMVMVDGGDGEAVMFWEWEIEVVEG